MRRSVGDGASEGVVRRPLVVEFAGLPGAGKTTLAGRVAGLLREQGVPADEPLLAFSGRFWGRRTPRALMHLFRRPAAACRALGAIGRSGQRTGRDAACLAHTWLFLHTLMGECRRSGRIALFDQGIIQALWSVALNARHDALPTFLAAVRETMCRPDVVVVVDVHPDVAARRLRTRPYGRSRLERGPWNPWLFERGVAVWRRLEPLIATLCADVMVVPNDRGDVVDESVRRLAGWITGGAPAAGVPAPPGITPGARSIG